MVAESIFVSLRREKVTSGINLLSVRRRKKKEKKERKKERRKEGKRGKKDTKETIRETIEVE